MAILTTSLSKTITEMLGGATALHAAGDDAATAATTRTARVPSATVFSTAVMTTCWLTDQLDALKLRDAGATVAAAVLLEVKVMVTGDN